MNFHEKRSEYLAWEDYFMAVAFLSAQRSKDPSTQVGACIVNEEKKIVGIGYNGMPNHCSDDELPWSRDTKNWLDSKYPYGDSISSLNFKFFGLYCTEPCSSHKEAGQFLKTFSVIRDKIMLTALRVCHAEMNAIMNKNSASVKNCIIYVALFPCNECAKLIIQAGIKEVIYFSDKHKDKDTMIASRKLLDLAGVNYRQHIPKHEKIEIDFGYINRKYIGRSEEKK